MPKITNHRKAEIHLPILEATGNEGKALARRHLTLWPGVNEVSDADWEKVKKHKMTRHFLRDEALEINGKVAKDATPKFEDYVNEGNEPNQYLKRFPKGSATKEEVRDAQEKFEKDQKDFEDNVRGTKVSSVDDSESDDEDSEEEKEESDE